MSGMETSLDAQLPSPGIAKTVPEDHVFQRGDRVVLTGSRHGHVVAFASQNYAVHLDAGNGRAQFHTVIANNSLLQRESTNNIPLSCTLQNRAFVMDGVLGNGSSMGESSAPYYPIQMVILMNNLRWLAAKFCQTEVQGDSELRSLIQSSPDNDISASQVQGLSFQASNKLNEVVIKNWKTRENTSKDQGLRAKFLQFLDSNGVKAGFILNAVNDVRAIQSWNLGIQDDFWLVGKDDTGSYVIPDRKSHEHVVYKVVGINGPQSSRDGHSNTPRQPTSQVRLIRIPMRLRMTILPWYGRLVYDTTIRPPAPESVQMANLPEQAQRLHRVVLYAIQAGTVIEHFADLE